MKESLRKTLLAASKEGVLRNFPKESISIPGKRIVRGTEFLDFSSWDILGLGSHPSVIRAVHEGIEKHSFASGVSRKSGGCPYAVLEAERILAQTFGQQAALLFSSRNQAIFSLFSAILNERDTVMLCQPSLAPVPEIVEMAHAQLVPVVIGDLLDKVGGLDSSRAFGELFLFCEPKLPTDTVNTNIVELCLKMGPKYSAVVDGSFELGLFGDRGLGVMEIEPVSANIAASSVVASIHELSYGLGLHGAVLSGSQDLIDAVVARSRTLAQEVPFPVAIASAIPKALDICLLSTADRTKTWTTAAYFISKISNTSHFEVFHSGPHGLISFVKFQGAVTVQEELLRRGFLVDMMRTSTKNKNGALLRITFSSSHSQEQSARLASSINEIMVRI